MGLDFTAQVAPLTKGARTRVRALLAASSIGLVLGAAVGAAWLGGHMARSGNVHSQAERLMDIADNGYDNEHFLNMSAVAPVHAQKAIDQESIDRSAMAIAMRYDPAVTPSKALRDRQSILLAQNLSSIRANPNRMIRVRKATSDTPQIVQASLGMNMIDQGLLSRPRAQAAAPFAMNNRSESDFDCLAQAVYYEARGETEAGQRAVAQVILNRVRHPAFPKTICNVVYQGAYHRTGCQFSFTCNGALGRRVENWAWKRAEKIASEALSGYVMASVGTSTHFHTLQVSPVWANRMYKVVTVGSHVFYQFKGSQAQIASNLNGVSPSRNPQLAQNTTKAASAEVESLIDEAATPATPNADLGNTLNGAQSRQPELKAMQVEATLKGPAASELANSLSKSAKPATTSGEKVASPAAS